MHEKIVYVNNTFNFVSYIYYMILLDKVTMHTWYKYDGVTKVLRYPLLLLLLQVKYNTNE